MIDKNKQYTTRCGLPFRLYATDGGGDYPVHGAVLKDDKWNIDCWTCDGMFIQSSEHSFDLIEVKPRNCARIES